MHHRPTVRSILGVALLMFSPVVVVPPAFGGIYYEANTTVDDAKTAQKVRAWVDGPNAKVEFLTGKKKDLLAAGNYLVTTDGAETVYLVDPKEKTYQVWDLDALFATFGTMMEEMSDLIQLTYADTSSEKVLDEPGEAILGHPTQHVRWNMAYTLAMKMGPVKQKYIFEVVQDAWITDELEDEGFGAWLRKDRFKSGNEEFDRLMATEANKIKGFPLRTVVTTTTLTKKGKSRSTTSITEVTELREESVDAGVFEIPPGYVEVEMELDG